MSHEARNGEPILFCDDLEIGQEVFIRWTSSGRMYQAFGPISKINRKSIKVSLRVAIDDTYPVGFIVTVPVPGTELNGAWFW